MAGVPGADVVSPEEAAKMAQEAAVKAGMTPEQAEAAAAAAKEAAAAAKEAAAKVGEGATPEQQEEAIKKAREAAEKMAEKIDKTEKGESSGKNEPPAKSEDPPKKDDPPPAPPSSPVAADNSKRPETAAPIGSDPARSARAATSPEALAVAEEALRRQAAPKTRFRAFIDRRAEVEKAIEDDPQILKKDKVIKDLYFNYLKKTAEVRQTWAKKKKKDFATDKINERLKDADVFEQTEKMVDNLHQRLFPSKR
jgi:hypothetical protein